MRDLFVTPAWAWAAAAATTVVAVLESAALPWAPFLILYALALPLPALLLGTARFGSWAEAFGAHPGATAAWSFAILAWEIGLLGFAYEIAVRRRSRGSLARLSPSAAMQALLEETRRRRRLSPFVIQAWFGAYFLLWAPLAEELFFWGYLYPAWRPAYGAGGAALLTAAWFALRHGAHFLFLPRPYPWPAACVLMASAGGAALMNGFLFEACGSLWPLMALHFASNLLSLALPAGPDR
jgi:membrane protease YdiL (CAAX protease family)